MKKTIMIFMLILVLSLGFAMVSSAEWKETNQGWQYAKEDGSLASNGWEFINGGWYFFDGYGYMLKNTLTPDGYWLDESGLASENKRIYGTCMFAPTSYQVVGGNLLITGNICDTQYSSEKYFNSLRTGSIVMIPSEYGRVCEFNRPFAITKMSINTFDAYYDEETGRQIEGPITIRKALITTSSTQDSFGEASEGYTFTSDSMSSYADGSMSQPIYRIIQKNVVLIADANTNFIPAYNSSMESLPEVLNQWTLYGYNSFYVMSVELSGNHIDTATDVAKNYIG